MGSLARLSLVLLLAAVSRASGTNSSSSTSAPSVSGSDVVSPSVDAGGSDAASGPNVGIGGSEVPGPSVDRSNVPESSVSASEAPEPGVSIAGPTRQNEIPAVPEMDKATYPPAVTVVDRGSAVAPVEVLAEEHTSDLIASTPRTELISEIQHTFLEPTFPTIVRPIKTSTLTKKGGAPVKKGKHAKKKHAAAYGSLLFIPLMIQAQIIPIMLLKLKLLAFKALTIGKLALLLLGLNLLRNYMIGYQSDEQQYEHQSLASEHYGYNGSPEYGSWVNRRVYRVEPKIHAELTRITPVRYNLRSSSTSGEVGEVTEMSLEPQSIEEADQDNSYSNRRRGALYRPNLNRRYPGFESSSNANHPYRGQIFKGEVKVIDL